MIPLALHNEPNLATMARLPDNSVDSIVTDPPYGLGTPPPLKDVLSAWLSGEAYHAKGRGFMGKEWDAFVPGPEIWRECLRVLKPGGHLISFFGTRTYHLGALAIEMAGFEVRDQLAWIFATGFPKSRSLLKPAYEPILMARKPGSAISDTPLNIDACRIPVDMAVDDPRLGGNGKWSTKNSAKNIYAGGYAGKDVTSSELGRYPSNVLHDGSPEVISHFPSAAGQLAPSRTKPGDKTNGIYGKMVHSPEQMMPRQDESTSAARFFYSAKASRAERGDFNDHPTVKPVDLMRWLCRLVTPPGGIVYDPFAGSGSTLIAAWLEDFGALGSEMDAHYCEIYERRKAIFPKESALF